MRRRGGEEERRGREEKGERESEGGLRKVSQNQDAWLQ